MALVCMQHATHPITSYFLVVTVIAAIADDALLLE